MTRTNIFVFVFFLAHALFAADTISISFVGPQSIHIAYEVGQHSEPVWLAENYSGFTQIKQVSGKGTYRFEPPANGEYRFGLCTNGPGWVNLAITSYDFQGDQLWGYMCYDEEINQAEPTISSGAIIVPESISLSLKRCSLDNDGWILRDFIVSGTLEVTANVTYTNPSWVEYHIYSFQSLAGCIGGEFHFKDGSGGSALTSVSNTTLFANTLLTLTGVKLAVLNCGDGGDVTADGCIFTSCTVTGENAAVSLKNSTVAGPCNVTKNATVTADNCVFGSMYLKDSATFTSTQGSLGSLLAEAPDGNCTMTDTTNGMLHIKELDEGTFARCIFTDRVIVTNAAGSSMSFSDCRMFGAVVATRAASQFNGCDFGGMVQVSTPCAARFNLCQFLLRLDIGISSASATLPTIENNSFLYSYAIQVSGDYSLTNVPVPIGANYFGDPTGPVSGWQSSDEMFKYRGGAISWWPGIQLATPLRKGVKRDVNDMPVYLWRIAQRYGQGTIPHERVWGDDLTCIKGRETVFIVDVGVNRHTLDNVEFRAAYNGTSIAPTRGSSITLYRDYSHLSTLKQEAAQNTINFILPPTTQDYLFVSVEYRLSNTQEFRQVCAESLYFHDAYERKLELNLVPVRLFVLGYSSGTPDAGSFASSFVEAMSAKTAIARNDIHIWYPRRPYNYIGAFGSLSLTFLLNDIALQLTAGRALISCCNYLSDKDLTIDYTIALLDDGVLKANGVDGASLPLFRNILFTDGDTDALLHEFGHAFGINTSVEQYDEFPKFGKRVAGVSAFVPEPVVLPGFMGDKRRLRHLPGTNLYWYSEKNFFDIMGGTPKNASGDFWPIQDTAYRFHYSLDRLLKTSAAAAATAGPAAAETRRIYVTGKTAQKRAGSYLYTYIVPWSLDIMNITEFSGRSEPGPESHETSDYHYRFDGFDSTGGCVYSETFYSGADDAMAGGWQYHSLGDWYRSFDLPDSVVAYRVTQLYNSWTREDEKIIWESSAAGLITTEIISPTPGAEIDADFLLRWNGQTAASALKQDVVPPLRYMVWASVDGGASWQPQTYMTAATEVNVSYAQLPAESNIIFRVISSDGFSTHSTTLSGLTILPHPPLVTIMTPLLDARGTTGTCWSLSADMYDPDGNETTNISWYSSLDGFLGTDATVTSCYLSTGIHAIECRAYDASGLEGTAEVTVHVTPGVDYALESNSLWLCSTALGPYAGPCLSIQTGTPLTVCFQMQSPGIATDIGAVISMTGPDAVTTTLATPAWTNISAFTPLFHTVDILPEQWGTYTFTAELTGLLPADTVPGDTARTIQCTTVTPPEIAAIRDTVDFVYQTETSTPTGRTVQVYNSGGSPLVVGQLTIGGMHATSFTLTDDSLSSSTLAPGATGTVRVIFEPMYVGCNQAYLALPCNDPRRTGYALDLKGDYLTPEPGICLFVLGLCALLLRRKIYG